MAVEADVNVLSNPEQEVMALSNPDGDVYGPPPPERVQQRSWLRVREMVSEIEKQLSEIELLVDGCSDLDGIDSNVFVDYYYRFHDFAHIITLIRIRCRFIGEVLDHDTAEYLAILGSQFTLLMMRRVRPTLPEMIVLMRDNICIVFHAVESAVFWVPGEIMETTEVMFHDFFSKAQELLKTKLRKLQEVDISFEGDLHQSARMRMHRSTVHTLLLNMAANSPKHGGARRLELRGVVSESTVQFKFSDDGEGIDCGVLDHIFQPGFSTGEGRGLGIADAPGRMATMGGSIDVDGHGGLVYDDGKGNVRQGAKFTLTLQRVNDQ